MASSRYAAGSRRRVCRETSKRRGHKHLPPRLIVVPAGCTVRENKNREECIRDAAGLDISRRDVLRHRSGGARRMKIYEGSRTIDGLVVTVDGGRLPEHYEVRQFTKYGFEWTYDGDSPQQLALAILFDYLGDPGRAIALSEPYMKAVIANLDNDWKLTGDDVATFLSRQHDGVLQNTH
jgi:hypothetical protein